MPLHEVSTTKWLKLLSGMKQEDASNSTIVTLTELALRSGQPDPLPLPSAISPWGPRPDLVQRPGLV